MSCLTAQEEGRVREVLAFSNRQQQRRRKGSSFSSPAFHSRHLQLIDSSSPRTAVYELNVFTPTFHGLLAITTNFNLKISGLISILPVFNQHIHSHSLVWDMCLSIVNVLPPTVTMTTCPVCHCDPVNVFSSESQTQILPLPR